MKNIVWFIPYKRGLLNLSIYCLETNAVIQMYLKLSYNHRPNGSLVLVVQHLICTLYLSVLHDGFVNVLTGNLCLDKGSDYPPKISVLFI